MENASKALLMAGGVLIGIIILAMLLKTYSAIGIFQNTQLTKEEQEQLIKFNQQYTRYLGQYVYGTDVITVINQSKNNQSHTITTKIKFANNGSGYNYNGYVYNQSKKRYEKAEINIKKGETLTFVNDEENNLTTEVFINSLEDSDNINRMAFKCTNIGYDNYGRVNSISFEEKQWGDLYKNTT